MLSSCHTNRFFAVLSWLSESSSLSFFSLPSRSLAASWKVSRFSKMTALTLFLFCLLSIR